MNERIRRTAARAVVLCAALCGAVRAEEGATGLTANWLPTAAGTYDWWDAANWADGAVPTNRGDTARFDAVAIEGNQTIALPKGNEFRRFTLGTVFGHTNQVVKSPARSSNGTTIRQMSVADPNGFKGAWDQADAKANWIAEPADSFVPLFAQVVGTYMPQFTVASNRAEIGEVIGGDGLVKAGGGALTVRGVLPLLRANTRLQVEAGTMALAFEDEIPTAVVPGAYLHLDAAQPDTFTLQPGDDGRTYVSEWRDCDGAEIAATKHPSVALPFLSSVTVVRGFPLVDFGASKPSNDATNNLAYWTEKVGPCGSLRFPRTTKVREVFVVFEDTQPSNTSCFVVGDDKSYHFHRANSDTSGHKLLDASFCDSGLKNNLAMVDGVSCSFECRGDWTRLAVVSVVSTNDLCLSSLCNDRNTIRYGGARIAEVLIYTNNLTQAERDWNHFVLRRKWTPGKLPSDDLRELRMAAGTTVDVADGLSVTVDQLSVKAGATVTKSGAGSLRVHAMSEDGFGLQVNGGTVDFVPPDVPVTDDAPAEDPQIWFDASCAASLVATNLANGAGGVSICRWNDRRPEQTSIFAATRNGDTTFPFLVPNAANGLSVLDFGDGWISEWGAWGVASGTSARFDINRHTTAYDGFVVIRPKMPNGYDKNARTCLNPPFFGTRSQSFTRWGGGAAVAEYADANVISALWEFDCVPQDARTSPAVSTNAFTVVSFSSSTPCNAGDRIANDRDICCGGIQIGELILYDRRLTSTERKTTQAYLMKKWKAKEHPALAETVELESLTYADGVEAKIETDRHVVVSSLTASGPFHVTGGGSVSVKGLSDTLTALVLDGGAFSVASDDAFGDALFHFDASVPETLECTVAERDGETVTNVTKWLDVRNNGVYAKASRQKPVATADPTLRTVETRNGRTMPVLDFGDVNVNVDTCQTSAGMNIVRPNWNGHVQEAHVVYSDAYDSHNGYAQRFIFADSEVYPCHRGENGQLFAAYGGDQSDYVKNGYVGIDGETHRWNDRLTDRAFHVVSLATSQPIKMRTIALDRSCRAGGSRQGELIAFAKPLSTARRTYVQAYLKWKWFGEGTQPMLDHSLSAVSLRAGAVATFPSYWALRTATVSGTGTLSAGLVADVETLAPAGTLAIGGDLSLDTAAELVFDFESPTSYDVVTVDGTFTATADTTIVLNIGKGADNCSGDFPILRATAFAGTPPSDWTRVVNNQSNRSVALVMQNGVLYLRLTPKGMVILIR